MPGPFLWGPNNKAINLESGYLNPDGSYNKNDGAKNYLANPQIETGLTTGWTLGVTGALTNNVPTTTPTFGSGASGNLTLSATSTTPLAGTFSLSYASSAATTAGNMVASSAFTVDAEDQVGKVLNFSFSYKATTGTANANWSGTSSSSFGVAIYDVTNSAWIIPTGVFNFTQGIGTGKCTGYFQTSATGTSYRLVVYNANATSGAITMYFDSFFLGPVSMGASSSVVSWNGTQSSQAVTANVTDIAFTTVKDSNAAWNGTQYVVPVAGDYVACGGINGSGAFTAVVYKNSASNGTFGTAGATTQASAGAILLPNCKPGDLISLRSTSSVTLSTGNFSVFQVGGGSVGPAGQVVAASAYVSANFAASTTTPINFDTKIFDTTSSITTSATAWKFIAPIAGYYQVQAAMTLTGSSGDMILYKNGSSFAVLATNTGSMVCNGSIDIQMNAGDYFDIRPGASLTILGASAPTKAYVSVALIQGPSSQQAAPSVNARYFASATSISGSLATVVWTTKDFDSANAMSSGVYTIPITGKYQVNSAVATTGTFALNNQLIIEIQKNGTVVSRDKNYAGGVVTDLTAAISDIISCVAGDTIRIQLSSGATSPSIVSSNFENYFSISLVGN